MSEHPLKLLLLQKLQSIYIPFFFSPRGGSEVLFNLAPLVICPTDHHTASTADARTADKRLHTAQK
jgi:hypothetical protein